MDYNLEEAGTTLADSHVAGDFAKFCNHAVFMARHRCLLENTGMLIVHKLICDALGTEVWWWMLHRQHSNDMAGPATAW